MKTKYLIGAAVVLSGFTSPAWATNIYFDDYTVVGGTSYAAADRYQSLGVVFNQNIPIENIQDAEPDFFPTFVSLGGSSPNALSLNAATISQIDMHFVVPGTATPTTTDHVQMLFMDTGVGTTLGTIEAFDLNNSLLTTSTLITPDSMGAILQVNAPGIAWVRFSVDDDGGDLDNLMFTPVPEPSSGLLLLGSAGAFGWARRRIKKT